LHIVHGDANTIRANVTTEYWSIPSDVEVTDTQDGNHVEIHVRTPSSHNNFGWFHWHSPKVEIDLEVPSESHLDLHTGFGDIRGENLHAHARVDTGFGSIHFPEFNGQLNGETGFGDVTADGVFDALELKSGFGSVRAEANSGSQIHEDWRLESGFGDVSLRVPSDLNADIDASTGMGHVSTDVPLTVTENSSHSEVRGQLGKGGLPLELTTGFGSVHLGRT
jgi:DUF4097 and DUF4098 domain-containing protein YvlB